MQNFLLLLARLFRLLTHFTAFPSIMRATTLRILPILACSALAAADATQVTNDFNNINTNLGKLDSDTNSVSSGILGITSQLQVSVDSVAVDDLLIATNSDIQASSPFTASESQSIVDAISTVAASSNKSLADLTSKYSSFGGLAPVVLASLYQLQEDQNTIGVSLHSKLDQSQIDRAVQILVGANAAFNAAIKTYGG